MTRDNAPESDDMTCVVVLLRGPLSVRKQGETYVTHKNRSPFGVPGIGADR